MNKIFSRTLETTLKKVSIIVSALVGALVGAIIISAGKIVRNECVPCIAGKQPDFTASSYFLCY